MCSLGEVFLFSTEILVWLNFWGVALLRLLQRVATGGGVRRKEEYAGKKRLQQGRSNEQNRYNQEPSSCRARELVCANVAISRVKFGRLQMNAHIEKSVHYSLSGLSIWSILGVFFLRKVGCDSPQVLRYACPFLSVFIIHQLFICRPQVANI
jgi:hypothetical protein